MKLVIPFLMISLFACDPGKDPKRSCLDLQDSVNDYCLVSRECDSQFEDRFKSYDQCSKHLFVESDRRIGVAKNVEACQLAVVSWYQCVGSLTCEEFVDENSCQTEKSQIDAFCAY